MISLDQILLLQQKVESAVGKISQLQAENDALSAKCSELTESLARKTEQLSQFERDQNKIEGGILKALEKLNTIENSILNATEKNVPEMPETAATRTEQETEPATVAQRDQAANPNSEFDIF